MAQVENACCLCGEPAAADCGVPMFNGKLVPYDWPGEWAGQPACDDCWDAHDTEQWRIRFDAEQAVHDAEGGA